MSKILLTGASGFLGSHLLNSFLLNNHEVVVLKRSTSNLWRIENFKQNFVSYNIDEITVDEVFKKEKPEIIVHTACSYGRKNESIVDLIKTNLIFSLEVFESAIKAKSQTFINSDSLLPKNINNYSLSKAQFSDWMKKYSNSINIINLKIEHMYGPKDDDTKFLGWLIKNMISSSQEEIKLTSGIQKRDFIFIDDIVDAFNLIIRNKVDFKAWNELDIGTGNFIQVREFVRKIALQIEGTNKKEVLNRLEFGEIPYREGEIMEPILDNSKIKKLGWLPKYNIEDGIKETLKNYL